MELSLLSSSLLLGSISESDFESNLLSRSFSKKALFATTSNTSDSWSLSALEASLPPTLKGAKAAKKSEDKLLSDSPIGELGLTALPIKKSL